MKNFEELNAEINAVAIATKENNVSKIFNLVELIIDDFGGAEVIETYRTGLNLKIYIGYEQKSPYKSRVDSNEMFITIPDDKQKHGEFVLETGSMLHDERGRSSNLPCRWFEFQHLQNLRFCQLWWNQWKGVFIDEDSLIILDRFVRGLNGIIYEKMCHNDTFKTMYPDSDAFIASEYAYKPSKEIEEKFINLADEIIAAAKQ